MRELTKTAALLTLTAAVALAGAGCEKSRDELRPDMDRVLDQRGPQSRELREMASKLAPDLMASPEITRNPYRVVVVMKNMDNNTEDMRGRDLNIYLVKLTSMLNTSVTADRILFVENLRKLQDMRAQEGIGTDIFQDAGRAPTADARLVPQYYLSGSVNSQANRKSNYYLFTFSLTNFNTGAQVWNGSYEVVTGN